MARKDEWITSKEAAELLSELSEHKVSDAYIRLLAKHGKILTKQIDARTKLYNRNSVTAYRVAQKGKAKNESLHNALEHE